MDLVIVIGVAAALLIAACTQLGARFNVASPLLLVVAGIGISYLPFVPDIEVEPEIILAVVLPPLLFSSAVNMPAMNFRREFRSISSLAVTLVVLSSLALGFVFHLLFPELGLAWCIALGAILSPTDAVATSIAGRVGISSRVTTILEGESLLNDATALVLLRTAVVAAVSAFSLWSAIGQFIWSVLVAMVVGYVAGRVGVLLRARSIDPTISTVVSITIPFVASVPTDLLGGSGLVAAVVAGVVTGRRRQRNFTPDQRISDQTMWKAVTLVLEGSVFLTMGLEMRALVHAHSEHGGSQSFMGIVWIGLGALALVLMIRAAYVLPLTRQIGLKAARAQAAQPRLVAMEAAIRDKDLNRAHDLMESPGLIRRLALTLRKGSKSAREFTPDQAEGRWSALERRTRVVLSDVDYYTRQPLTWRDGTVMVAAGMRGAVTLAAAQTLPLDTPLRSSLVLVAFVVAAGSLLLQGTLLGPLVRLIRPTLPDAEDLAQQGEALHAALRKVTVERRDGESDAAYALRTIIARRGELLDLQDEGLYDPECSQLILKSMDATEMALRIRLEKSKAFGTQVTASTRTAAEQWDQPWEVITD